MKLYFLCLKWINAYASFFMATGDFLVGLGSGVDRKIYFFLVLRPLEWVIAS